MLSGFRSSRFATAPEQSHRLGAQDLEFDGDGKVVRGEFITDSAKALKALG